MKKGAKKLVGTHNFSTFRAANCGAKSPIRTIKKIQILKSKKQIKIRIQSQSFLKSQVRSMVGSLKYLSERHEDTRLIPSVALFVKIIFS